MYDFFFVKTGGQYVKLAFSDLIYVEAVNKYVRIVTTTSSYLIGTTMCHIEQLLPHKIFRRIHRSYIVSLHYIKKFDSTAVYLDDKRFPIVRHYKDSLLNDVIVLSADDQTSTKLLDDHLVILSGINVPKKVV